MWWAGSSLALYVGLRRSLVMNGGQVLHDQACTSPTDGLAALSLRLEALPARHRARLWLSGALCRPFLLPDLRSFKSPAEVDAAADALGRAALDVASVRCWLQPVRRGADACLGVAVAENVATLAEQTLAEHVKGRLRLSPWWADATRLVVGADAYLAIDDGDSLTILQMQHGQIIRARTAAPLGADGAQATLMRWRAAGELPRDGVTQLRLQESTSAAGLGGRMALGAMTDKT